MAESSTITREPPQDRHGIAWKLIDPGDNGRGLIRDAISRVLCAEAGQPICPWLDHQGVACSECDRRSTKLLAAVEGNAVLCLWSSSGPDPRQPAGWCEGDTLVASSSVSQPIGWAYEYRLSAHHPWKTGVCCFKPEPAEHNRNIRPVYEGIVLVPAEDREDIARIIDPECAPGRRLTSNDPTEQDRRWWSALDKADEIINVLQEREVSRV